VLFDDGRLRLVMSPFDRLQTKGEVEVRWLGDEVGGTTYVVELHPSLRPRSG